MPKSIEQGFDEFIRRLAPLPTEYDKAQSHKGSVESCMRNNFECSQFFETGSFGNGTGVRHWSDTDYFAVCASKSFGNNPGYMLQKVKQALERTFWQTQKIAVKTPAVQIPFGDYASEFIEVTPCFFKGLENTRVGLKASYWIAGYDGWILSSPHAHNAYVKREDERLGGRLKPLIKLVKAWKFYNSVPILSFYLELRTTKYAESLMSIQYDRDLRGIIRHLNEICLASINDPMGISGAVRACSTDVKQDMASSKLYTAYTRSEHAFSDRLSRPDRAFEWWDKFFNYKFPAR